MRKFLKIRLILGENHLIVRVKIGSLMVTVKRSFRLNEFVQTEDSLELSFIVSLNSDIIRACSGASASVSFNAEWAYLTLDLDIETVISGEIDLEREIFSLEIFDTNPLVRVG